MLRLLQIEWMKIRSYRTFWILVAIIVVTIPAFNYTIYDFFTNNLKVNGRNFLGNPFAFPDTWQTISYYSSVLLFVPAILIITLITNEYSYRTHRQNIIDGWNRGQFISVKLVEVLILSVFVTLVVLLTIIYFGYTQPTKETEIYGWKNVRFLFFFFVQMISYSMIALLCGMFIRRAGLGMGIFFVYMVMEQFVVVLLREKYKITKVNYLPEEVTDRLIPFPLRIVSSNNRDIWEHHISIYLSFAAFYLILYCIAATWRFKKSDL